MSGQLYHYSLIHIFCIYKKLNISVSFFFLNTPKHILLFLTHKAFLYVWFAYEVLHEYSSIASLLVVCVMLSILLI